MKRWLPIGLLLIAGVAADETNPAEQDKREVVVESREDRFSALWAAHYQAVAKFVLRRLPEHEDPSGVVSEVFVTAWRRLSEVPSSSGQARPWLYEVAHKTIANRLRGSRRRVALETRLSREPGGKSHDDPQDRYGTEPSPGALALVRAFNGLSTSDREAIALVTWEDLTPAEAAKVIGMAPARFRVRLHRAKTRLRDRAQQIQGRDGSPGSPLPLKATTEELS